MRFPGASEFPWPRLVRYPRNPLLLRIRQGAPKAPWQTPLPDDHSETEPPLPIPNRTVKRFYANDSADTRVKVGNRQAPNLQQPRLQRGCCRLRRRTNASPLADKNGAKHRRRHPLACLVTQATPTQNPCARA